MYKQLTIGQRYTISSMRQNGSSFQAIANELFRIESEAAISAGLPIPKKELPQRLVESGNVIAQNQGDIILTWLKKWPWSVENV
jgi:hypothetical protein